MRNKSSLQRVPKTGVYSVSKGDVVIPAHQVKKIPRVRRLKKIRGVGRVGRR